MEHLEQNVVRGVPSSLGHSRLVMCKLVWNNPTPSVGFEVGRAKRPERCRWLFRDERLRVDNDRHSRVLVPIGPDLDPGAKSLPD